MRQRELHLPSKRSQLEIRMLRLPSLQHLRLVPGPHWPQPTHLPLQQLWEKVGDVTETPKVLRVEHTIFVFVNDSSGQLAVTTSEPKSCFHTYLKILIKFNNHLILLYGNGRGMGADLMRNRTNLIFLKSGAKVRRKADSCKHFGKKMQ